MSVLIHDIVVVGAGPAGLSVAIEAGKKHKSCLVIDKGSLVNTIRRYPTYAVFFSTSELLELGGVPFPAVNKQPSRQEALRYYTKLAQYFKVQHALYQYVEKIEKKQNLFEITTNKAVFKAKNVVIAIGYYEKYNKLNVIGEDLEHVSHFYTEPYPYVGRKVTIIGGSNSAGEAALDLYRNGAQVSLVHRGEELYYKMKYWVKPDLENRIKEGSITAYFNSKVLQITPNQVLIETPKGQKNIETETSLPAGFYTPETLATYLGVSVSTIYSWNSSGYGPPFVKLGNLVRYTYEDVEIWLVRQLELSRG